MKKPLILFIISVMLFIIAKMPTINTVNLNLKVAKKRNRMKEKSFPEGVLIGREAGE